MNEAFQEFDFDITHIKDKKLLSYAMSRWPMASTFSYIKSTLIYEIITLYANDDVFKLPLENQCKKSTFIKEVKQFKYYDLKCEILFYNARVCIPKLKIIESILCMIFVIFL